MKNVFGFCACVALAMALSGCGEKKNDPAADLKKAAGEVGKAADQAAETVKDAANEAANKVEDATK